MIAGATAEARSTPNDTPHAIGPPARNPATAEPDPVMMMITLASEVSSNVGTIAA